MNESTAMQTATPKPVTLRSELEGDRFRLTIAKVLPKHLTPDRFVRIACLALTKTPKLANCDRASFFNALMTLSQYGLEPDGRNAHLIPFENRKRNVTECQLIIDYKGIVDLVMRTGEVARIHADIVCENDEFDYNLGEIRIHRVNFRQPRGEVYAAYAMVFPKDGGPAKCDVMTKQEIEVVRMRSHAGQNGPWVTDWNEMAKKTVFRRLSKWLRLSSEIQDAMDSGEPQLHEAESATPAFEISSPQTESTPATPEQTPARRGRKPKLEPVDDVPMDDNKPPVIDVPSETVSASAEEPAPTTEATQSVPDEDLPDLDQPFAWLVGQMKKEGISERQVIVWCRKQQLARDTQTELTELASHKIKQLATTWHNIKSEIKAIQV